MWIAPRTSNSSPESADSDSQSSECGPLRVAWVTSSGTPMQRPHYWHGWRRRPWIQRLFGSVTYATWNGAAAACGITLTSSAPGSLARIFHLPDEARGLPGSALAFGGRSIEPLASYDPDSRSWRTSQQSLFEGCQRSLDRFPKSGITVDGFLYELPTLGRLTEGRGGLVWPTAQARDSKGVPSDGFNRASLPRTAKEWPTPDTINRKSRKALTASTDNGRRSGGGNSSPPGLEQVAEIQAGIMPTELDDVDLVDMPPKTREMIRELWPTPDACLMNDGETVESWDARRARLKETSDAGNGAGERLTIEAKRFPSGHPAPPTESDGRRSSTDGRGSRRRLNVEFVTWLQGFPEFWTDIEPTASDASGTPSSPHRQKRLFGDCSRGSD